MHPLSAFSLAALALLVLPAAAPAPLMTPSRDVDVTYTIIAPTPPGAPAHPALTERMRWDVANGRYRVDPPTPGMWMVVNNHSHTMTVVREAEHEALVLPRATPPQPSDAAKPVYTQSGTATVAGQTCTVWSTTDARGEEVRSCVTADGVLLRATIAGHTVVEAKSVSYGPEPASVFAVPTGFAVKNAPATPPHTP